MTEETPTICPVCNETLIPGCRNEDRGGGIILKQDADGIEYAVSCKNMIRIALRRYMQSVDPLLSEVPAVRETPLYQHEEIDRTKDNLFCSHVEWGTFLAHLKWVLGYKHFSGTFIKIVTDMTLLNIYVGNASMKARLRSQIEEEKLLICNSLEDLLESPDLVIIRLGHVTHFNRAAAHVLQEALNIRRGRGKPTWIIEPLGKSFQPYQKGDFGDSGMPCCDADVQSFVKKHFDTVELAAVEGAQVEETREYEVDEESSTVSLGDESSSILNEVVEGVDEVIEDTGGPSTDDVDDLVGPDRSNKKKGYNNSWKKRK